jgi:hypothetical protein
MIGHKCLAIWLSLLPAEATETLVPISNPLQPNSYKCFIRYGVLAKVRFYCVAAIMCSFDSPTVRVVITGCHNEEGNLVSVLLIHLAITWFC